MPGLLVHPRMKLLAFGDLHMGAGDAYGPTPGARLRDQEAALDQVVQIAIEEEVDAVLIAGDVFDRPRPSPEVLLAFWRPMLRLRDHVDSIVAITGNAGHDIESGDRPCALDLFSHVLDVRRQPGIWNGPVPVACLPSVPVSRLVASSNGGDRDAINERAAEFLIETARGMREQIDGPAILLLHWSISGAVTPTGIDVGIFREPILDLGELEALGFDAVVASHIHKPQILSPGPLHADENGSHHAAGKPILYTGSPCVLNFGEAEVGHGVWLLTVGEDVGKTDRLHRPDEAVIKTEFRGIDDRRFVTVDCDLTTERYRELGLDETDAIAAAFATHLPLEEAVVRIRYAATDEQARSVDTAALRKLCADAGVSKLYSIAPDIVRAERARVAVDDSLGELEMLEAWIGSQDPPLSDERAEALRERTSRYLEEVRS